MGVFIPWPNNVKDCVVTFSDIRLCSLKEVSDMVGRPLAQVQILDRAHALGQAYTTGAQSRYYPYERIVELATAPRWDKAGFVRHLAEVGVRAPKAVILRQIDAQPTSGPAGRTWYGFDMRAELSENPAKRAEQTDASRMVWKVNAANLSLVRSLVPGQSLPMVITAGGLVVAGREIVGVDEAVTAEVGDLVAFAVQDAGSWLETVKFGWLNSGPGQPILWWDVPQGE